MLRTGKQMRAQRTASGGASRFALAGSVGLLLAVSLWLAFGAQLSDLHTIDYVSVWAGAQLIGPDLYDPARLERIEHTVSPLIESKRYTRPPYYVMMFWPLCRLPSHERGRAADLPPDLAVRRARDHGLCLVPPARMELRNRAGCAHHDADGGGRGAVDSAETGLRGRCAAGPFHGEAPPVCVSAGGADRPAQVSGAGRVSSRRSGALSASRGLCWYRVAAEEPARGFVERRDLRSQHPGCGRSAAETTCSVVAACAGGRRGNHHGLPSSPDGSSH